MAALVALRALFSKLLAEVGNRGRGGWVFVASEDMLRFCLRSSISLPTALPTAWLSGFERGTFVLPGALLYVDIRGIGAALLDVDLGGMLEIFLVGGAAVWAGGGGALLDVDFGGIFLVGGGALLDALEVDLRPFLVGGGAIRTTERGALLGTDLRGIFVVLLVLEVDLRGILVVVPAVLLEVDLRGTLVVVPVALP